MRRLSFCFGMMLGSIAAAGDAPYGHPDFRPSPEHPVGWRGDGSGAFPGATPPAEFDGVTGKNLVWKTPLPNYGNASPIVVGKNVFVVCEAGWPETQDCAQLLCFDADTGKELWRREIDEFAAMPPAQAKEARELRKEYYRRYRRLNTIMFEWQSANAARRAELLKEAQSMGKVSQSQFDKAQWGNSNGQNNSPEPAIYGDTTFGEKLARICGYLRYEWTPLSANTPTPVSDGQRIVVWTSKRSVHAFDLKGNIVWQNSLPFEQTGKGGVSPGWGDGCDPFNSPLIVDSKVVMFLYGHLWAYDLNTGKLAWKAQASKGHYHGVGTPTILRLKPPGAAGRGDAFAFTWTGDLVRIRDGKTLQKSLAHPRYCGMVTDGADTIFIEPDCFFTAKDQPIRASGPKSEEVHAVRFAYEGADTVVWKKLFAVSGKLDAYPVFHEGRIYTCSGGMLDSQTGKLLSDPSKVRHPRDKDLPHGFIMAGECFYGIPRDKSSNIGVVCEVMKKGPSFGTVSKCKVEVLEEKPADPVKRGQRVAMAGWLDIREWSGWHAPNNCPFPAGNRLYIQTFDHLYCFGGK